MVGQVTFLLVLSKDVAFCSSFSVHSSNIFEEKSCSSRVLKKNYEEEKGTLDFLLFHKIFAVRFYVSCIQVKVSVVT